MRKLKSILLVPYHLVFADICLGIEGSEGITALSVSPSRKYVAVCEKAERAICIIWDVSGITSNPPAAPKRRKVLTSSDYNSKEFLSAAFAPTNEKSMLVTLVSNRLLLQKAVILIFKFLNHICETDVLNFPFLNIDRRT